MIACKCSIIILGRNHRGIQKDQLEERELHRCFSKEHNTRAFAERDLGEKTMRPLLLREEEE